MFFAIERGSGFAITAIRALISASRRCRHANDNIAKCISKCRSKAKMGRMKLRIATYNIHKGVTSFSNQPRIHALKQALTAMQADVLFLQEVQGRHDRHAVRHADRWPGVSQHDFLAGDSHHAAYGMNAVYDHGHHGNALLSCFPIASSRNQDISDHAFEQRGILHCVVQTPKGEVHCYVVHLGLFAGSRKRQTQALIAAVEHSADPGTPIIIAGDFNDWGDHLGDDLRARLGVNEVFETQAKPPGLGSLLRQLSGRGAKHQPARTFPAALPWFRLDRIYVRGFTVESAQVLRGTPWVTLSDHVPIVATVQLKV
jgi:endonuclease/exonuclease/phosphatase family metal-dependent hydrolase